LRPYFNLKMGLAGIGYHVFDYPFTEAIRQMPLKAKAVPGAGPPKIPAWADNLILLNILKTGFNFKTGVEIADFLSTNEVAVSRARQGIGDIAGLAPAVLEILYPGVSEIALQAQLTEYELRKHHAQMELGLRAGKTPSDEVREAFKEVIAKSERRLSKLRDRLRETRRPRTSEKRQERDIDRATLASLEGQLSLYRENYEDAATAFEAALSYLDLRKIRDLGSRVLFVRLKINWYFANDKKKVDVSRSLAQEDFVKLAVYISFITGDSRLSINVAEAVAVNELHDLASNLLCDAAELLKIKAADLPQHHPVGYDAPLHTISPLKKALERAKEVEKRRYELSERRKAEKCDINGVPFGSLPDDVSLNLGLLVMILSPLHTPKEVIIPYDIVFSPGHVTTG
jgi:hypothetical protein